MFLCWRLTCFRRFVLHLLELVFSMAVTGEDVTRPFLSSGDTWLHLVHACTRVTGSSRLDRSSVFKCVLADSLRFSVCVYDFRYRLSYRALRLLGRLLFRFCEPNKVTSVCAVVSLTRLPCSQDYAVAPLDRLG